MAHATKRLVRSEWNVSMRQFLTIAYGFNAFFRPGIYGLNSAFTSAARAQFGCTPEPLGFMSKEGLGGRKMRPHLTCANRGLLLYMQSSMTVSLVLAA